MNKYFTLLIFHEDIGRWAPEFGDSQREVVQAELEYWCESYPTKKKHTKIITTSGRNQILITSRVNKLNKKGQ